MSARSTSACNAPAPTHLWLDARIIERLLGAVPDDLGSVSLRSASTRQPEWLPVAPAAHYLSGGVVADLDGASHAAAPLGVRRDRVQRRARREPARVELVARRLGVLGHRVVSAIVAGKETADETGAMHGVLALQDEPAAATADPTVPAGTSAAAATELRDALQHAMSADCGVARDPDGLARAALRQAAVDASGLPAHEVASHEVLNLLHVAAWFAADAHEEFAWCAHAYRCPIHRRPLARSSRPR